MKDAKEVRELAREFDHLSLVVTGNDDIKAAYYAGFEDGRAKEREVYELRLSVAEELVNKRVQFIETGKVLPKRNTETEYKNRERKWYVNGHLDALKIFKKYGIPNPNTIG